ncbi:unnamed protein product [Ceutorhynchus assimilis]|uniref:Chromo domain-containing protein n=1 Tax=Ceutorhynchus assimilis TaxID=467358 RepID=A0A9N9MXU2_9CUCU|nr:unnamed protein product [Ceutorhynchus assimilis]
MEEAAGHRVSVSMPSLDATDDFPAGSAESATTDSVFSGTALENLDQTESPFLNSEILTEEALKDDLDETLEDQNKTQESIESEPAEDLIAGETGQTIIDTSAEGLDESQGDEDPSIAIDQFIKKIADEQLSSKRIEEREEEEIQEKDVPMALDTDLDETPPIEEATQQEDKQEDSIKDTNENIEKPKEPESMDIEEAEAEQKTLEKVVAEAVGESEEEDDDDEHMPESIEEIQKEIDKIPGKKLISKAKSKNEKEEVNNGICEMDEDIEDILAGVQEEKNVGNILKVALEKEQKLPTAKDSAEVAKNPDLIEQSKEELSKLDILICGDCHNPFYFTQEFIEHKKSKCPKVSSMINNTCEGDNQQQIWGYCLWKSKYLDENEKNKSPKKSNWFIYQAWCNLPQAERTPWIAAGISIQFASKLANANVTEMRPSKMVKQSIVQKITNPPPPPEFIDSNKENSSIFSIDSTGNIVKKGATPARSVKLNEVRITPAPKIPPTSSNESMTNSALRSGKIGAIKEEFVVEKIMAKRFNPRRKTWEYNIKWENFGHDSNTWEPMNNLSHCKKLLEQFEEQLKRMKEEKAKSSMTPRTKGRPSTKATNFNSPKITNIVGGVTEDYGSPSTKRPQRHCKQKALNQVKQWCDTNSDEEDDDAGLKRKYNMDDDSDDDFEDKRIKLEFETEDSDEAPAKTKMQIKKMPSTPRPIAPAKAVKNGNKNTTPQQPVPSNILIPDANGVVRINQKQLPSLKSGVYIMSKTAGIIKLDSNTSKMATSGGQTVVKVLPKIGQSHVKVVSKDGKKEIVGQASATPVKISQASAVKASTPRITPKLRQETKRTLSPNLQSAKMLLKKIEEINPKKPTDEEESDDGLEPLPFPAPDEPIPPLEEEEKNDDFVLDPETGKIAGIEYVDKPVVIKKEPQIEPATTTELENIVKIAAAELSDDDFDAGNDSDDSSLQIKEETPAKATPKTDFVERTVVDTSQRGIRKIIKYTVSKPSSTPTVLNKYVGQGQVTAKPKPIARPQAQGVRPPQKIINQMITQPKMNQHPQIKTVYRQASDSPRPGTNVVRKSMPGGPTQMNRPRNNLVSKPLPSPLPPTRTYSAMGGIRQTNRVQADKGVAGSPAIRRVANTIVRASPSGNVVRQQAPQQQQTPTQRPQVTRIVQRSISPQKKPVAQQQVLSTVKQIQNKPMTTPVKSKTVINMPSLMEEDSPLSPPPKAQPKPSPQRLQPKPVAQPKPAVAQPKPPPSPVKKEEPSLLKTEETPAVDETSQPEVLDTALEQEDWSSFTMNDGENPIFVTGDDGTVYQVAGQNDEGQTILLTQGPDGQQQCLLVSNEIGEMIGEEEPQPSTSTANVVPAEPEVAMEEVMAVDQTLQIETPLDFKTDALEPIDDQVVAQVVQADPLSPGGTHKVVVMLPDGSFMLTKVTPEEYANLEIST